MIQYKPTQDQIVYSVTVDFKKISDFKNVISIVQYDDRLPVLGVSLCMDGKPYVVPDTASVRIRFGKKDGSFSYNDALGVDVNNTKVFFAITRNMTAESGYFEPVIELTVGDKIVNSSPIGVKVQRNPIQDDSMKGTNEWPNFATKDDLEAYALQEHIDGIVHSTLVNNYLEGEKPGMAGEHNFRPVMGLPIDVTSRMEWGVPDINADKATPTPYAGVNCKVRYEHSSDVDIYTVKFPQEIYKGTFDWLTGELSYPKVLVIKVADLLNKDSYCTRKVCGNKDVYVAYIPISPETLPRDTYNALRTLGNTPGEAIKKDICNTMIVSKFNDPLYPQDHWFYNDTIGYMSSSSESLLYPKDGNEYIAIRGRIIQNVSFNIEKLRKELIDSDATLYIDPGNWTYRTLKKTEIYPKYQNVYVYSNKCFTDVAFKTPTDTTMSKPNKSADAATVGESMQKIDEKIGASNESILWHDLSVTTKSVDGVLRPHVQGFVVYDRGQVGEPLTASRIKQISELYGMRNVYCGSIRSNNLPYELDKSVIVTDIFAYGNCGDSGYHGVQRLVFKYIQKIEDKLIMCTDYYDLTDDTRASGGYVYNPVNFDRSESYEMQSIPSIKSGQSGYVLTSGADGRAKWEKASPALPMQSESTRGFLLKSGNNGLAEWSNPNDLFPSADQSMNGYVLTSNGDGTCKWGKVESGKDILVTGDANETQTPIALTDGAASGSVVCNLVLVGSGDVMNIDNSFLDTSFLSGECVKYVMIITDQAAGSMHIVRVPLDSVRGVQNDPSSPSITLTLSGNIVVCDKLNVHVSYNITSKEFSWNIKTIQ